jgi:hypothetical protein
VGIPRLKIWSGLFTDTIPDPITLSDAESVGAESGTDYSNPYVNHKTKSGSDCSHVADNEAADGDDLGSGTTNIRPRKRVRFATETEEDPRFVDASNQEITATLSENLQESEEIPIHGYLTLQAIQSKVAYCLKFSQGFSLHPRDQEPKGVNTSDFADPQSVAPITDSNNEWVIRRINGQKVVDGMRHYRVQWEDTWMPESGLTRAKELVDAFMAHNGSGTGDLKRPLKRGRSATAQLDVEEGKEPK